MNAITLLLICGSVWFCFQLLAVLIGWRLAPLRARAVVEWQDCDVQPRNAFDDHVDSALEVLLTHEAGVDDGAGPERWIALEEEFADLDGLAAQLGERAS